MSERREKYDRAHSKMMEKINDDSQSLAEQFVKGIVGLPKTFIHDMTNSDIEDKAERDALNGRYDPPDD